MLIETFIGKIDSTDIKIVVITGSTKAMNEEKIYPQQEQKPSINF
ncbi:MAG: hypothetical protein ACK452_16320 [Bacteroidota bacterium]|jgi:hypothetical protein